MDVIETIVGAHIQSVAAVLFERNKVTKHKKWVLGGYSTFVENTLSDHWMIPNVSHNIYLQEQLYNCTGNNDLSFVELIQTHCKLIEEEAEKDFNEDAYNDDLWVDLE
jgi:hypothetical protein